MSIHDQLLWADKQPVTNARRSDRLTWKWCYEDGLRPARYPVPAVYSELHDPDSQGWEYVWSQYVFYPPWRKSVHYGAKNYPL